MDNEKANFYSELIPLTFFLSIAVISINLDFGAYIANSRSISLVNHDVIYLRDMQISLPNIPSIESIIQTQECNSILISLAQSPFLLYGLITLILTVVLLFFYKKRVNKFDHNITKFRLILKQGKKIYLPLFTALFAISLMFIGLGLNIELSKGDIISQRLGDIADAQKGQKDKIILLETFLFDASQDHFEYLFYGFYILGSGLFSLLAYVIHIVKKGPNLLSSAIIYAVIFSLIYFPILLIESPTKGYSSIINSDDFDNLCTEIINTSGENATLQNKTSNLTIIRNNSV